MLSNDCLIQGIHIVLSLPLVGITMVLTKGALEHLQPLADINSNCFSVASSGSLCSFRIRSKSQIKAAAVGLFEPDLSYILASLVYHSRQLVTQRSLVRSSLWWPALRLFILRERISSLIIVRVLACRVALIAAPGAASTDQGSQEMLILLSVLFAALYSSPLSGANI